MFRNLFGSRKANPAVAAITPAALKRRLDTGEHLYLLDVRSSEEYAHDGYIAGARLLPLPLLSLRVGDLPKDVPIVCICLSGSRSNMAATQLARQGFPIVLNLTGGMGAWKHAGLPVKRG